MTRYYNIPRLTRGKHSGIHRRLNILQLSLLSLILILSGSCQKQVLELGSDLLPASDFVGLHSIDTLSVFSYTVSDDSINTSQPVYSYLGENYDPYFGTSTASFVTQLRLASKWDGKPFTVDSMRLFLHILSTKGQISDAVRTFSLYEIADQLYTDSLYYSNSPLNLTGFNVEHLVLPTTLRTDTINDLEIKLPDNGVTLGKYLLRDTLMLFHSNVIPDFRSYFKGFLFKMDPTSDPLLLSLSLVYDATNLTYYNYFVIYGHDEDNNSKEYSFNIDAKSNNAHYNRYTHDYSTATIGDKMVHRNTTYRDTLSYLQGLNGVYTRIYLPGLVKLKNDGSLGKIAVNKSRLTVPFKFTPSGTNFYLNSLPQKLYLRYKTKSGARYDVPDYTMASTTNDLAHTFFSGVIDTVNNVYKFNIPAFLQSYLEDETGEIKPEVEIYQTASSRNVVFEANKSKKPVKLEFTYTKF